VESTVGLQHRNVGIPIQNLPSVSAPHKPAQMSETAAIPARRRLAVRHFPEVTGWEERRRGAHAFHRESEKGIQEANDSQRCQHATGNARERHPKERSLEPPAGDPPGHPTSYEPAMTRNIAEPASASLFLVISDEPAARTYDRC